MIPTAGGHTGIVASSFVFPESSGLSLPSIYLYPPEVSAGDGAQGLYFTGTCSGYGTLTTLTFVPGLPGDVQAVKVAAGWGHFVCIGTDGLVYGAGGNSNGQITGSANSSVLVPLSGLPSGVSAVQIDCGENFTAVLGDDGVIYGCGKSSSGQITGTSSAVRTLTPFTGMPTGVTPIKIVCGQNDTLVLGDNGRVYGCGKNNQSKLTGGGLSSSVVTTLTELTGGPAGSYTDIASGTWATVAFAGTSNTYGCGYNSTQYALGNTFSTSSYTSTLTDAHYATHTGGNHSKVYAFGGSTVIMKSDGNLFGVGLNTRGQLTGGSGTGSPFDFNDHMTAFTMPIGVLATDMTVGYWSTVIIGDDNNVWGCGSNLYKNLTGTDGGNWTSFKKLTGLPTGSIPTEIAAGNGFTLVIAAV